MGEVIDSTRKKELESRMDSYGLSPCKLILFQGPDSREAAKGMFQELHSDVRLQQLSINDIYIKMDSLQRELGKVAVQDTLQKTLGRQLHQLDSSLSSFAIRPVMPFNPGKNRTDTSWLLTLSFSNGGPFLQRDSLDNWLRKQLGTDQFVINLESKR